MLAIHGCTGDEQPIGDSDASSAPNDSDSDWLCNTTEARTRTDPHLVDSDGDRVPDGIEVQYAYNPLDAADPGPTALVLLAATPGGQTEVDLHVVVDGAGESFAGEVDAWPALEAAWPSAERYFAGAVATSAEPPDHVFGFPTNGDQFGSVVGETRLGFRLRFVYGQDTSATCAQVVTFNYAVKRQDGVRFGDRRYLLIVAPDTNDLQWCPPSTCI